MLAPKSKSAVLAFAEQLDEQTETQFFNILENISLVTLGEAGKKGGKTEDDRSKQEYNEEEKVFLMEKFSLSEEDAIKALTE